MKSVNWTYTLRLLERDPDSIPMERLADYLRAFSDLIGVENKPVFKGIKKASTGLRAFVPPENRGKAQLRLVTAQSNSENEMSRPIKVLQSMMSIDRIPCAELLDESNNIIALFSGVEEAAQQTFKVKQQGSIDGVVTGIKGADDTINVYVRDSLNRDLIFICRNVEVSRQLLQRFRLGSVRLHVHGSWIRTEQGWIPEQNKCYLDSFEDLDEATPLEVFRSLNAIPNNGWINFEDPVAEWEKIRGISA